MDTCKHGTAGLCDLCANEDREHDAAMAAYAADDSGSLDALRKDAARYRWARDVAQVFFDMPHWTARTAEEVDAEIDEAIKDCPPAESRPR